MKNRTTRKSLWLSFCMGAMLFCLLILPLVSAKAEDKYWTGESGWWHEDSNWEPYGQPQGGEIAYLVQDDEIDRTVSYIGSLEYVMLYIDATGSGTMTLNQLEGLLYLSGLSYIGYYGTGVYDLTGGWLHLWCGHLYIGYFGKGTLNQSNGRISIPDGYVHLGQESTGEGTFNLIGGHCGAAEYDLYVGVSGKGTVNQEGGAHHVGWILVLGNNPTGEGTYNLSGGRLYAEGICYQQCESGEVIGRLGKGTFNQTGGEHKASSYYGRTDSILIGSKGTYNLSGGTLMALLEYSLGKGTIINNNAFNYSGGEIDGNITNNGTMTLSGSGIRTVNGDVTNNGTIKVTDTIAQFVGTFTNHGAFVSDPALNFFADLVIEDGTMEGTGADLWYIGGGLSGVDIQDTTVGNIFGPAGMKVYYLASVPENAYLGGLTYDLVGGGHLLPTLREPYEVKVDIKPESEVNRINLKSKGAVPVAVLTTESFDADDIEPDTCVFAGSRPRHWAMEYVDDDSELDMLIHFDTEELNLSKSSTEAILIGETLDGTPIWGADMVDILRTEK